MLVSDRMILLINVPDARWQYVAGIVFGLIGCQMTGLDQINQGIDLITHNSARCLNIQDRYGIEVGKPANFIILDGESVFDVIRRQAVVTHSIRHGRLIASTTPSQSVLHRARGSKPLVWLIHYNLNNLCRVCSRCNKREYTLQIALFRFYSRLSYSSFFFLILNLECKYNLSSSF